MNQELYINLLPWRAEQRFKRKKRLIMILIASAILAILTVFLIHLKIAHRISKQEARNDHLKREISLLDFKIRRILLLKERKRNLLARMNIILELQDSRFSLVRLLNEIVKIIPNGIVVHAIERKGHTVTLQAQADSNASISELMKKIHQSKELSEPNLSEIRRDKTSQTHSNIFKLTLFQKRLLSISKDEKGKIEPDKAN